MEQDYDQMIAYEEEVMDEGAVVTDESGQYVQYEMVAHEEEVMVDDGQIIEEDGYYQQNYDVKPPEYIYEQQPSYRGSGAMHYSAATSSRQSMPMAAAPSYMSNQQPRAYSYQQPYNARRFSTPIQDARYRGYYDTDLMDVKPIPVVRPSHPAVNLNNSTPLISSMGYPRTLSANAGGGNSLMGGSILTSFMNASKAANKMRKASSKKKPCNCTKSQCLKLYCECFANGEFCLDCNCRDCHNNLEHESERSRAIKSSLERNPTAFKPKIGVSSKVGRTNENMERLHQKGCHCKKSNCLKNYCECYEAKVPCTERCKCCSCRNTEQHRHHKFKDKFSVGATAGGLAQLAAVAAADARRSTSPFSDDESDACGATTDMPNPKTQPWLYLTDEVTETITMCLVTLAQEMEGNETPNEKMEQDVLQEFARCLEQIIESAKACEQQQNQITVT